LRGKGIGSFLIKIAEDEARKRGFKEMTLGVEALNTKAIQLYEKLGYREFMKEKGDEGEEIIGMIKIL
jgi:ribosomal protein S18 acetylase RimI-like enzyme